MKKLLYILVLVFIASTINAQTKQQDPVVEAIIKEATENSQLKELGFYLTDVIGPRLVGTPEMQLCGRTYSIRHFRHFVCNLFFLCFFLVSCGSRDFPCCFLGWRHAKFEFCQ